MAQAYISEMEAGANKNPGPFSRRAGDGAARMSKPLGGVTMPRAIVPYIRKFAAATTSPRALRAHAWARLEALGAIIAEHAWVVDEHGRVIETTWPDVGTAYFGVAFDEPALRRAICATPCFCLLCRKALPRIAADYTRPGPSARREEAQGER